MRLHCIFCAGSLCFLLLALATPTVGEEANGNCALYAAAEQNSLAGKQQKPLIFGEPYSLPSIRLKIEKDRQVVRPTVDVFYIWEWLEYPYPEHALGAWSEAWDWHRCSFGQDDILQIPSLTIRPRGWYDGLWAKLPWPRKPHFDHLELTLHLDGCAPKLRIQAEELAKYARGVALLRASCESPIEVAFGK